MTPFLTLYTPTYKRPIALGHCLASVAIQSAVADIEQIVVVDHVGIGVHGMYARVPQYAGAVHGQYVAFLCDDDVLASPVVVEDVRAFIEANGQPPLVIVQTRKAGAVWPANRSWPPEEGAIDLNCAIVRSDVWHQHVGAYGHRYEGDFDFLHALAQAGIPAAWCPVLFSIGAVSRGAAEAA